MTESSGPSGSSGPSAPTRSPDTAEHGEVEGKKVTWAELSFDLVFVVAVTQVSELLLHEHSWPGLALLPAAVDRPALAGLALLAAVLIVLNLVGLARARSIGWRARLRARGRVGAAQ